MMMQNTMIPWRWLGIAMWALSLTACATVPAIAPPGTEADKSGELLVKLQTDTKGQTNFRLSGDILDGATLTGPAVSTDTGWTLTTTGLDWFNNWINGWTDAHFVMDGELELKRNADTTGKKPSWHLLVHRTPTIDVPDRAKIRYYDQYLTGDSALTRFGNRWDRIQAATTAVTQHFGQLWFSYTLPSHKLWGTKPPSFKDSIGPWLFPEVYGYSTPPPAKHSVQWGEDIPWNTDYSAAAFAGNLRPVRDSGTLLRDFEESPEVWRLCYVWPSLWATQAPAAALIVKSVFFK
jgi:hypothetical protein